MTALAWTCPKCSQVVEGEPREFLRARREHATECRLPTWTPDPDGGAVCPSCAGWVDADVLQPTARDVAMLAEHACR